MMYRSLKRGSSLKRDALQTILDRSSISSVISPNAIGLPSMGSGQLSS